MEVLTRNVEHFISFTSLTSLPKSLKDTEANAVILTYFDDADKHRLFLRWDRIFINFSQKGEKLSGYWHIDGHKPELTLLSLFRMA